MTDDSLIKQSLESAKTIAIVGVSFEKSEKKSAFIRRRPSIIVMKYLQEFGYRVIPVNPFSVGKKINEETVVAMLEDIKVPIVPGAILFDLLNGGNKKWKINPYSSLGKKAYLERGKSFKLGTVGAGTGATTSNLKGGLGSASVKLGNGINVGALVAVNSFGSSIIPGSKCF